MCFALGYLRSSLCFGWNDPKRGLAFQWQRLSHLNAWQKIDSRGKTKVGKPTTTTPDNCPANFDIASDNFQSKFMLGTIQLCSQSQAAVVVLFFSFCLFVSQVVI